MKMKSKSYLWLFGLVVAILTAIISYCSCSVLAVTAGKAHSTITTTTTTTTRIDSNSVQTPNFY